MQVKRLLSLLLLPLILLSCQPQEDAKKVLIYTKNGEGFIHDNLQASIDMLTELADENGIEFTITDKADVFTEDQLQEFDALIFSNTNNEAFDNDDQRKAFKNYQLLLEGGKSQRPFCTI